MESRYTRRSERQSKNQLYTSLAAIIVILIAAFTIGPLLIGIAGNVIDTITGKTGQQQVAMTDADIQPPTLDSLPVATPSAHIDISGKADYRKGKIELFVNGSLSDTTGVSEDQSFTFENVSLRDGGNFIKIRIVLDNKKSNFSDEKNVILEKSAPKLEVYHPADQQQFTKADKQITVRGKTDSANTINVNGFTAIVDQAGNFSYDLNLNNGENKISITATSPSGRTTNKDLTVAYSE